VPLYRSFINRFGLAESAVAASIHYYESHPRLSREGYKTDISPPFYLLLTYEGLISAQAEVRIVRNSTIESKIGFSRDTPTDLDSFCLYVIGILPIKVKTRESYLSAFRCHIQGFFAGKRVNEVTKVEIQLLLAPLKPQIRAKVLAILKTIFREAILLELIDVAPTVGIRNPAPIVEMRKFFTWD
jgi:hypothetical protein